MRGGQEIKKECGTGNSRSGERWGERAETKSLQMDSPTNFFLLQTLSGKCSVGYSCIPKIKKHTVYCRYYMLRTPHFYLMLTRLTTALIFLL
jgi:hypothetical protein